MSNWMIYGAYGYTGKLVIEEALRRGHKPLLAGRDAAKLMALSDETGLDWMALGLGDHDVLAKAVAGVDLVFHAAGPFIRTSDPMIQACISGKTHYLDITGEIPVFENTFTYDALARDLGIALISGVGFDIVPTDCLAAYVATKLANPTELEIALMALGSISGGTTKTLLEMLPKGGFVRRNGRLVPHKLGEDSITVTFANGKRRIVSPIPWGDLATAERTTGIANVTTYMPLPQTPAMGTMAAIGGRLLGINLVRKVAQTAVSRFIDGPSEHHRQTGTGQIWARVRDADGNEAEAWLQTIEGYQLTAVAGVRAVEKTLANQPSGALTPATAFGADFVLEIEGSQRWDELEIDD